MKKILIAILLLVPIICEAEYTPPPSNIIEVTNKFDSLVKEIGFEASVSNFQISNSLTRDQTMQYLVWMSETRAKEEIKVKKFVEPLNLHHITCMRNLRKCSDNFLTKEDL